MSSFFTTPASQKKRKFTSSFSAPASKRRTIAKSSSNSKPRISKAPPPPQDDDSISGSGSEDEAAPPSPSVDGSSSSDSETAAETRLRLASQYLTNLKSTITTDPTAFDAEDIDRDLIAERLQQDVAELKGDLHKYIASHLDFSAATMTNFRNGGGKGTITGVAVCESFVYTASKDGWLVKWQLPDPSPPPIAMGRKRRKQLQRDRQRQLLNEPTPPVLAPPPSMPRRRRPTKLLSTQTHRQPSSTPEHRPAILAIAASPTGDYLATGTTARTLTIYSTTTLTPLRTFTHHRDSITSLSFRPGSNQLFTASKDRSIKTWSLDSMAYVETLFGHQDEVLGVAAAAAGPSGQERCVSVGGRDRTARVWKVVEETQLVFRGGGGGGGAGGGKRRAQKGGDDEGEGDGAKGKSYAEGSIDCVALVDDETFVTGSDNGGISLWSVHKKKPVFTVAVAHGLETPLRPEEASAEADPAKRVVPEASPRWITALATVACSDLVVSGSWDGEVRGWRVSRDKRQLEGLGLIGRAGGLKGVVNDIRVFERGEKGREVLGVVVGVGTEYRLGRWKKVGDARGRAVYFEVPRIVEERNGIEPAVDKGLENEG